MSSLIPIVTLMTEGICMHAPSSNCYNNRTIMEIRGGRAPTHANPRALDRWNDHGQKLPPTNNRISTGCSCFTILLLYMHEVPMTIVHGDGKSLRIDNLQVADKEPARNTQNIETFTVL